MSDADLENADVVEQLRVLGDTRSPFISSLTVSEYIERVRIVVYDAADMITQLRAENERLTAELAEATRQRGEALQDRAYLCERRGDPGF